MTERYFVGNYVKQNTEKEESGCVDECNNVHIYMMHS